jgi:C-terminal processing protease CtpA/Prc
MDRDVERIERYLRNVNAPVAQSDSHRRQLRQQILTRIRRRETMTARSGWWRLAAAIALIGAGAVGGSVVSTKRTLPDLVAESQHGIILTRPIALNTDVTIPLETGQAAQLNFEPNPYSLEKYLLYFYAQEDGQKIVRGDVYFTDGQRTGGGTRTDLDGALRQLGYTPCLAIIKWHVREGQALVNLRVSDDIERNYDEYRQYASGGKKMSIQYKDRRLIPASTISETERLAGFVQLWSEAKFNFAFWDRVPQVDWDAVLLEFIPKVREAQTDAQYYRVLRRCIALLQDGHTDVWGPTDDPECRPPVEIAPVQGKAVIVRVYPAEQITQAELKNELIAANLKVGEEITQVDGRAVEQILAEDLYPYIAASTPQQRELNAYPQLARGEQATQAMLRVRDLEGRERDVRLTRGRYGFPYEERPFLCELPDGILRINLDSFDSDEIVKQFDGAFDKVLAAKGLILDLRNNGGGSSGVGYGILKRLIDKPVEGSHWKTRQYMPAFRAWGREEQWYEGTHGTIEPAEGKRYEGPVAVLTGPATASAAEDFVVAFQTGGRGKVVGRRTLGSTGQPLMIKLPGGGGARICTKRDTYPDGREFVGIGCIPDVEVAPTRADIAAGRDVVLEKAVELLQK